MPVHVLSIELRAVDSRWWIVKNDDGEITAAPIDNATSLQGNGSETTLRLGGNVSIHLPGVAAEKLLSDLGKRPEGDIELVRSGRRYSERPDGGGGVERVYTDADGEEPDFDLENSYIPGASHSVGGY